MLLLVKLAFSYQEVALRNRDSNTFHQHDDAMSHFPLHASFFPFPTRRYSALFARNRPSLVDIVLFGLPFKGDVSIPL